MLFDTLEGEVSDLVVAVFVQPDRVSHMFWRGLDPQHPLYEQTDERARGAVQWIYRESDRILGRVLDAMAPDDRLIVLSDHGFDTFRRAVHLGDSGLHLLDQLCEVLAGFRQARRRLLQVLQVLAVHVGRAHRAGTAQWA